VMPDNRPISERVRALLPGRTFLPVNQREAHNALAFRMVTDITGNPMPPWHPGVPPTEDLFAYLRAEIEKNAPETVVLVAELFGTLPDTEPALLGRLESFFEGARVKIVATFRRPDAYIASWHAQRLKFREFKPPLRTKGLDEYLGSSHLDYRKIVEPWHRAFPDAQFVVSDYADIMARGGSIEAFQQDAGLAFPPGLPGVPRGNPSVPYAFREVVRHGVRDLSPRMATNLVNWTIRNHDRIDHVPDKKIELFGAQNRARLKEAFEPVHDFLGDFTGRAPFFADFDKIVETREIAELDAARESLPHLKRFAKKHPPRKPVREFLEAFDLSTAQGGC